MGVSINATRKIIAIISLLGITIFAPAVLYGPTVQASAPIYVADGDSSVALKACEMNKDASICNDLKDRDRLPSMGKNVINAALFIAGILAVIMLVYGSIVYTTSAGKSNLVEKGKKIIIYSIVGLIVCILSFAIVNFAIGILK